MYVQQTNLHQLACVSAAIRDAALLQPLVGREEDAIQDGGDGEDSTDDGTCSTKVLPYS